MRSSNSLCLMWAAFCCVVQPGEGLADRLPSAISDCRHETDDARRLRCYDQAVAAASTSAAAAGNDDAPAAAEENFGVRGGPLARQQTELGPEGRQINAKLARVTSKPRGELVMTLDNGQVWVQLQAAAYFPLKPGDSLTIKSGALGSYILVAPSGRSTKVKRLQ